MQQPTTEVFQYLIVINIEYRKINETSKLLYYHCGHLYQFRNVTINKFRTQSLRGLPSRFAVGEIMPRFASGTSQLQLYELLCNIECIISVPEAKRGVISPTAKREGSPLRDLCPKFINGNISELIQMTAMVVLHLWCFIYISIFEDYDDQILKNLSCCLLHFSV